MTVTASRTDRTPCEWVEVCVLKLPRTGRDLRKADNIVGARMRQTEQVAWLCRRAAEGFGRHWNYGQEARKKPGPGRHRSG